MKPSNKVSTLRTKGFSIVNTSGFICRIASMKPFIYGEKRIDVKDQRGDYRIEIRGHYTTALPKSIQLIEE